MIVIGLRWKKSKIQRNEREIACLAFIGGPVVWLYVFCLFTFFFLQDWYKAPGSKLIWIVEMLCGTAEEIQDWRLSRLNERLIANKTRIAELKKQLNESKAEHKNLFGEVQKLEAIPPIIISKRRKIKL